MVDSVSSGSTLTSTSDSKGKKIRVAGGDPEHVAKVFTGVIIAATALVGLWLNRGGKQLRKPTETELASMSEPLARIAVRHLPMDAIGPDVADGAEAVVAIHGYLIPNPEKLVTRLAPKAEIPAIEIEEN